MSECDHQWRIDGKLNDLPIEVCVRCGVQRGRPDVKLSGEMVVMPQLERANVHTDPAVVAAVLLMVRTRACLKRWAARYAQSDHARNHVRETNLIIQEIDEWNLRL